MSNVAWFAIVSCRCDAKGNPIAPYRLTVRSKSLDIENIERLHLELVGQIIMEPRFCATANKVWLTATIDHRVTLFEVSPGCSRVELVPDPKARLGQNASPYWLQAISRGDDRLCVGCVFKFTPSDVLVSWDIEGEKALPERAISCSEADAGERSVALSQLFAAPTGRACAILSFCHLSDVPVTFLTRDFGDSIDLNHAVSLDDDNRATNILKVPSLRGYSVTEESGLPQCSTIGETSCFIWQSRDRSTQRGALVCRLLNWSDMSLTPPLEIATGKYDDIHEHAIRARKSDFSCYWVERFEGNRRTLKETVIAVSSDGTPVRVEAPRSLLLAEEFEAKGQFRLCDSSSDCAPWRIADDGVTIECELFPCR